MVLVCPDMMHDYVFLPTDNQNIEVLESGGFRLIDNRKQQVDIMPLMAAPYVFVNQDQNNGNDELAKLVKSLTSP